MLTQLTATPIFFKVGKWPVLMQATVSHNFQITGANNTTLCEKMKDLRQKKLKVSKDGLSNHSQARI